MRKPPNNGVGYIIDLAEITDQLLREGVDAFAKAFRTMLASIEGKRGDAHEG